MFGSALSVARDTWQAFERNVCRYLSYKGYRNVRLVGQSSDHGADVLATLKSGKRCLVQVKHWKKPVGKAVVEETLGACKDYSADIPVVVSLRGYEHDVRSYQASLMSRGIPLQLWDTNDLIRKTHDLPQVTPPPDTIRRYQEDAIQKVVARWMRRDSNRALVVLATGLGKTFVAAESIRRIRQQKKVKVLVCAHTNDLVLQLERSFWKFMNPADSTVVWNQNERHGFDDLDAADITFACVDTVSGAIESGLEIPQYDVMIVDECHHAGSSMYDRVMEYLSAGKQGGAFLIGLTATPWRPDETDIAAIFGDPLVSIDMVYGLQNGFLTNVDYRMYTSNINWDALRDPRHQGRIYSPKQLNRTLFIEEWDDAVVYALRDAWKEQPNPRAIVFCGTIDHALAMRDKINLLGFCKAAAIYSGAQGGAEPLNGFKRNLILSDFADGRINVICAVDIFNEGIDVPDVNILVFQRVTHSRRIFIQQLGRGLRIADDKSKVIVLDFVSDVRRFAAGIGLKDSLARVPQRISIPNRVSFVKVGGDDPQAETFLRNWLKDVAAIENAGDDASVLQFPPPELS